MNNDSWRELVAESQAEKSAWLAQREINRKLDAIQKQLDELLKKKETNDE